MTVMDIRGIGIDVVEVQRIEQALARWGDSFVSRIFTPDEDERARHPRARSMRLAPPPAPHEGGVKGRRPRGGAWGRSPSRSRTPTVSPSPARSPWAPPRKRAPQEPRRGAPNSVIVF